MRQKTTRRNKPFLHLGGWNINTLALATATHGEVHIERGEAEIEIALGDDVECGRVVENVIVEREFATEFGELMEIRLSMVNRLPGDRVNALGLDACPAGLLHFCGSFCEIIRSDLASPVGFDGLLDLTVGTWITMSEARANCDKETYRCEGNRARWRKPFVRDVKVGDRMEGVSHKF